jgi:hypothetical protein
VLDNWRVCPWIWYDKTANRVLRFNSGRGLQLSQSTYKPKHSIGDVPSLRAGLSIRKRHWALDAAQLKRRVNFRGRTKTRAQRCPAFCAMQQSIAAMRQLSVNIMVYQRI